jgi:hypothetical protein
MKKSVLYAFGTVCLFILLQSFGEILGKRDGTEPGHTGSPGDSLKNCTVCHGGVAVNVDGWITSNIPASGFVPGQKYTIKATNTRIGHTRFGFQVSPQDVQGNLLGTIEVTDTLTTKLVGNDKYITYRTAGVDGVDSLSWYFDWIAPDAMINEVVFYGAFNSNHDGHKGGDVTQLTTMRVYKEGFTAIDDKNNINQVSVYPTVASDLLTVRFTGIPSVATEISIFDMQGAKVATLYNKNSTGASFEETIHLPELKTGIFFLVISQSASQHVTKIVINQ